MGFAMFTSEPEISAQQIAQHEDATGVGGVPFLEVMAQGGIDPALRLLIEVWGELPDGVRNQIVRLADDSVRVTR